MSRIGRKPIPVPPAVKVSIVDSTVEVEGPKGKLSFTHPPGVGVSFDQASRQIVVTRQDDERTNRALHGLTRSLVANMVQGVTAGYYQAAGDRRRRLPGAAQEGQHGGPPGRLRQPGGARGAARA